MSFARLVHRLRPSSIAEVLGQGHLLAAGAPLGDAVRACRPHAFVAWGPPGTGKSALIASVASDLGLQASAFSGPLDGAQTLQRGVEEGVAALLVDDLHGLPAASQDVLAAVLDRGVLVFATSAISPAEALVPSLRSRLAPYRFQPLSAEALDALVERALRAGMSVEIDAAAREYLVAWAQGDGRRLLDALDRMTVARGVGETVGLEEAVRATEPARAAYPSPATGHFDVVTAFVKSLRGSDPDAALYWLACMLSAGEEADFIARRLRGVAAEDVGLADPFAVVLAGSVASALKEGASGDEVRMLLAHATTYVATAPKSSAAARGLERAESDVRGRGAQPVPLHLRQRSLRGTPEPGYSQGAPWRQPKGQFLFPQYLPDGLTRESFFEPTDSGAEGRVRERLRAWWPERF